MSKIVLTDEASAPAIPAAGTTIIYTAGGVLQVLNSGGTPAAPILPSIFMATGQLLYASAPSTPTALTIGTAGQFLRVSGGLPVWSTVTAGDVGAIPTSALTASNPASLAGAAAPGASTDVARLDHVHPFPSASDVSAVALSTVTTAGDLIYATGAGAVTRLGIGTAGQVLAVNSGATAPVWQNPPTFVAGPAGSTAQYTGVGVAGIAAAISAATATGGVVEILPGTYSGASLSVPAGVHLVAAGGFGSVILENGAANVAITLTGATGTNVFDGIYLGGDITQNTAASGTRRVVVQNSFIESRAVASALSVGASGTGWEYTIQNTSLDTSAVAAQPVINFSAAATVILQQVSLNAGATAPTFINLSAGSQLGLEGDVRTEGAIANATLYTGSPTIFGGGSGVLRLWAETAGAPGAVTINKPAGKVQIAAAALSVVVTNDLVTASSIILATLETVDGTLTQILTVTPGPGSFTITGNALATGAVTVSFVVIN